MGYINDQEWNTYNSVIKDFNEVVLKDFQYKLTNKILGTKSFLHRIRNIKDNLCSYCIRGKVNKKITYLQLQNTIFTKLNFLTNN